MPNKGTRAEQELVNILWNEGYAVIRSPASGGVRDDPQPDVLASNGKHIYAIECKATKKDKIYIPKKEISELNRFCKLFGFSIQPLLAVRFNYTGWCFYPPDECETTKKSYKIQKDNIGYKSFSKWVERNADRIKEEAEEIVDKGALT